jgi:16S rRNA (guanine966-N2)-methyltransferase
MIFLYHAKMSANQVRIIAGKWRGRKINFQEVQGLRPTTDRMRETLFNWLAPVIEGSRCLDLFTGSGAIGFEALSRGAQKVLLVDQSITVLKNLKENIQLLQCDDIELHLKEALRFLKNYMGAPCDIIFLDPPFYIGLAQKAMDLIDQHEILKQDGYLYLEQEHKASMPVFPKKWEVLKDEKKGHVRVFLIKNSGIG